MTLTDGIRVLFGTAITAILTLDKVHISISIVVGLFTSVYMLGAIHSKYLEIKLRKAKLKDDRSSS